MKKFHSYGRGVPVIHWKKWSKMTRLGLLLVLCLQFSAFGMGRAQNVKVSLDMRNVTLEQVLKELKAQTGMRFFYSVEKARQEQKDAVQLTDATLDAALQQILEGTPMTFEIQRDVIVIKDRPQLTAQTPEEKTISGKVTDESGQPLPGVTILLKGTTVGVVTDIDGLYSLQIPSSESIVFVFSFVGMKTQEIPYRGQEELNIVMQEDVSEMDEVVVTGYQKIERRQLTSSITTVDMDNLKTINQPSIDKLLQGQVPGMTIMSTSGAPGAVPQIRIRGTSTISGNVQPLWVVDGVILDDPVDATVDDILTNRNLIASGIGGVNVDDIESINILKDAAATAIYGTRAANGVIVITSKKGQAGKTRINYNGSVTVGMRPRIEDAYMMNSKDRIDVNMEMIERGAFSATSSEIGDYGSVTDFERWFIDVQDHKMTWEEYENRVKQLEEVNTDWFKELFRNSVTHRHSLSISGGNEKTTFYLSGSYMDNQATAKNVSEKTYTGTVKVNTYLRENLRVGGSLDFSARDSKSFFAVDSRENPYEWAIYTTRAQNAYDENGDYNYMYYNGLKYNFMENRDDCWRESNNFSIRGQLDVEWRIIPDLTFTSLFSFSKSNTRDESVANEDSYFVRARKQDVTETIDYTAVTIWNDGGYRQSRYNNLSSITFRNQLSWMPIFGEDHRLDVMIGQEIRTSKTLEETTDIYGYAHDRGHQEIPQFDLLEHLGTPMWNENLSETAALSYFLTAGYTYKNRYTISFNARTDGSNRFGLKTNELFQPLWAIGVNYQLKEENFLKDKEWLTYLTLKGSYGSQGNVASQAYSDLVATVGTIDAVKKENYLTINAPKNPNLKWEINRTANVAMEFGLFNRRVYGSLEWYYKKGIDLLGNRQVSLVSGFSTIQVNWASMKNTGWEFAINTINIDTDAFRWTSNLNFGYNYNEVLDVYANPSWSGLSDPQRSNYAASAVVGKPINGLWSFQYAGLNEEGRAQFLDAEGNKVLSGMSDIDGLVYSGTTQPLLQGGFTNTFYYKKFTLSALFIGSFGNVIRLRKLSDSYAFGFPTPDQNMSKDFAYRWRQPGDEAHTDVPRLEVDEWDMDLTWPYPANAQMYNNSDLRTVKGNFLRLSNLSLSYDLYNDNMRAKGIQNIRFMIQGNNLHVWKNKRLKGQDPEATGSQMSYADTREANVSFGNTFLPLPRSYSFSVSVSF